MYEWCVGYNNYDFVEDGEKIYRKITKNIKIIVKNITYSSKSLLTLSD